MKILSWNVNGLRSVYKQGFVKWLDYSDADIVCLQETKIQDHQVPFDLMHNDKYECFYNSADKKGYSGVSVYSRHNPTSLNTRLGHNKRFDSEGRYLELRFPGFTLLNLYIPHGGRGKENLAYKLTVYKILLKKLEEMKNENAIIIGDFNIAHKETDLARPKQNKNNIMFTEEERQIIDSILDFGYIDTFRKFNKKGGNYTWISYYKNAREKGLGWRIDYTFTSKKFEKKLKDAFILTDTIGSDHVPIGVEIDI